MLALYEEVFTNLLACGVKTTIIIALNSSFCCVYSLSNVGDSIGYFNFGVWDKQRVNCLVVHLIALYN